MYSRSMFLAVAAASITLVKADDPFGSSGGICYAYGVDFIDEGSYFIDSESTEDFSAVTYFKGCNADGMADVVLVAPDVEETTGEEYLCDKIPTTPDDTNQVADCPIKKNQMSSGHWLLLILGDNEANEDGSNGQPFAWQRDLYLTVGTKVTSTYTATTTDTKTETPTITSTVTTTSTDVVTAGPFSTVTMPSGTAKKVKTIRPKAVTETTTKTMTRTRHSWTKSFGVTTKTVEATCTTPAHVGKPDKPCEYSPTKVHAAAIETPTTIPKFHRWVRKGDREVDYEWARARVEAAKQRRAEKAGQFQRRAPDAPTTTVTYETPVAVLATVTAPAITTTESVLLTQSATETLPPPTVLSGLLTSTTTLPTPTKTKSKFAFTTTTEVITFGHVWTTTTTVLPTSSVSACKKHGGHFWWI
ncbi:uncharacterized protein J4E78_005188 [Alternaria triticimaculans]|uniref:uncharacterized protein n=1 Tax=Alternaria triticimaculans TaxID=297637 RepID=UPI0020C43956|nr:uncharacterized protein J4E78_005188 [Alternaria triticimaculans]KAI4660485.1 hypothetical protein J4E78_005188 [Alternaria triticimaculans]